MGPTFSPNFNRGIVEPACESLSLREKGFLFDHASQPGRELQPLESSAFHGALLRQLRVELFPMRFSLEVEGYAKR